MKTLLSLFTALFLAGCAGNNFSSSVHSVSVDSHSSKTAVMAPSKARSFENMAQGRNQWVATRLADAITTQLKDSNRFQPTQNSGDGQVVFNSIRHGLIEVSANLYAVTLTADVTLRTRDGKNVGTRSTTATSGMIRPLVEFENSGIYEEAIGSAADRMALELVSDL